MAQTKSPFLATAFVALLLVEPTGHAQSMMGPSASPAEENFREVFVTAGYSAAFGAALGAALLPFMPNPDISSLRYVAGGASLGFIAGSGIAFVNLSSRPANGGFALPPEESQDSGNEDEDLGPVSDAGPARPRLAPLPSGALFVGQGSRAGFSFPSFALAGPGGRGVFVSVLDWRL